MDGIKQLRLEVVHTRSYHVIYYLGIALVVLVTIASLISWS